MGIGSESCREFLETLYVQRKRKNPRYSLRALARHLTMSPGELSEILRGLRPVTSKTALRIAKALDFSAGETKFLVSLAEKERINEVSPLPASERLASQTFALASDWFCWALIALTETPDFSWNGKRIAKRLGVSETEVRIAIDKLKRAGILIEGSSGLVVKKEAIVFDEGIPSQAIREYHRQILSKAEQALELQAASDREFSGITVAINASLVPVLKKEISNFLMELGERYGSGKNRSEVYHVEIAAFRLTQGKDHDA